MKVVGQYIEFGSVTQYVFGCKTGDLCHYSDMIVSTLREMRAKFSYCSDLMSSTEYDPILVHAVAAVVKMDMKEHRIISGSGQISKIKVD